MALATALQYSKQPASAVKEFYKQLVSQFFPNPAMLVATPCTKVSKVAVSRQNSCVFSLVQCEEIAKIPQNICTIPALASIARVPGGGGARYMRLI